MLYCGSGGVPVAEFHVSGGESRCDCGDIITSRPSSGSSVGSMAKMCICGRDCRGC